MTTAVSSAGASAPPIWYSNRAPGAGSVTARVVVVGVGAGVADGVGAGVVGSGVGVGSLVAVALGDGADGVGAAVVGEAVAVGAATLGAGVLPGASSRQPVSSRATAQATRTPRVARVVVGTRPL